MEDQPGFTRGWKIAIVVALVAALADGRIGSTDQHLTQVEQRLAKLEKSVQKIEDFLYYKVDPAEQAYKQKSPKIDQRLDNIEKTLKGINQPNPKPAVSN